MLTRCIRTAEIGAVYLSFWLKFKSDDGTCKEAVFILRYYVLYVISRFKVLYTDVEI